MGDVDLKIRAETEGFPEAAAAIDDVAAATVKTAGAQDTLVASTEVAISQAYTLESIRDNQLELLHNIIEAHRVAEEAVTAMGNAGEEGGKKYKEAISAAADSVAKLEIAQAKVRERGGPVTEEQIAALKRYDGAVQAHTENIAKSEREYRNFSANLSVAQGQLYGLGRSMTVASGSVGFFGRAIGFLAGPWGLMIAGLVAAPALLKAFDEWTKKASASVADWALNINKAAKVFDEHGKAIDHLAPGYRNAAAAADLQAIAVNLMAKGLIPANENMKVASAHAALYMANLRGASTQTDDFARIIKDLGLKMPATFEAIKVKSDEFLVGYQMVMTQQGPLAAKIFAEENKASLESVMARYSKMNQDVPPIFTTIAASIGVTSKAETELAKNDALEKKYREAIPKIVEKIADLMKALDKSKQSYLDHAAAIEVDRKKAVEAIEDSTKKTIAGLNEQVRETQAAHAARAISETDYNTKVNGLFAAMAKAKSDGYEAEVKRNTDTKKEQTDLATAYQESSQDQVEAINDLKDAEVAAKETFDNFNTSMAAQLITTDGTKTAMEGLVTQLGVSSTQAVALGGVVDGLTGKMNNLATAARNAASAVASVTDGGGGGNAGSSGG